MYRDDEQSARVLAEALANELAEVTAERDELRGEVDRLREALGLENGVRDMFHAQDEARRARQKNLGVQLEQLRQEYVSEQPDGPPTNDRPISGRARLMNELRENYDRDRAKHEQERARRLGRAVQRLVDGPPDDTRTDADSNKPDES